MIGDAQEKDSAISRWQKEYQNDFMARMDWSISVNYKDANYHPKAVFNNDATRNILKVIEEVGTVFSLSVCGSDDPDGNCLFYLWEFYKELSTYKGAIEIQNAEAMETSFVIPEDAAGKTIHIIFEIHDDGEPNLYAYRRVVIKVEKKEAK